VAWWDLQPCFFAESTREDDPDRRSTAAVSCIPATPKRWCSVRMMSHQSNPHGRGYAGADDVFGGATTAVGVRYDTRDIGKGETRRVQHSQYANDKEEYE
jgi:hypothetical protein